MPELPEVEIVRRGLDARLKNRTITALDVAYSGIIKADLEEFRSAILGGTIVEVKRRGKYLIFDLGQLSMVSHLRMEGKFFIFDGDFVKAKHQHLFFHLDDGSVLVYQDVRKFGTLELVKTKELSAYFSSKKLGPEPTEEDFDLDSFSQLLAKSKKKIKPYLLEQTLVAGLGNIYVDEVLWAAKVHPERLANSLSQAEVKRLRAEIIRILQLGIEKGGSTIRTYQNAFGQNGTMQDYHKVYDKTTQPCSRCATPIEKIKVGGRGSHFCPNCQKL